MEKELLEQFMNDYINPSFGSLSKKEIDMRVFDLFIKMGKISPDDSIFTLISTLKISRAKARSLIYDYNLRKKETKDLKKALKDLLQNGSVAKDSNIKIEVDDPYLTDYIRDVLKRKRMITDGSFKPELLVLSTKAYSVLLEECLTAEEQQNVRRYLYEDSLATAAFNALIQGLLEKYAGKDAAKMLVELGSMAIQQKGASLKKWFKDLTTKTTDVEE